MLVLHAPMRFGSPTLLPSANRPIQLADEPTLLYKRLFAFDGNNSLKRLQLSEGCSSGDIRTFEDSDYFLPTSYVDSFANEVRSNPQSVADKSIMDANLYNDAHPRPIECHKNWKAAAPDSKKSMWSIFEETGIFASACRHSLVLWVADMVRSGEKYVH